VETLVKSAYPVGFAVSSMSLMVIIILLLMWVMSKDPVSARIGTPTVVISLFMLFTFITVTVFSTLKELPETKTGELLLGALISTFTVVITFWFAKQYFRPDDKDKP
jgi:hypothetical protein